MYGIKFNDRVNTRLNFDYDKSLFSQIHNAEFTMEEYVTYINEPKHFVNPVKDLLLFDNWFLETISKSEYWYIIVAFIPYWIYSIYMMTQVNFSGNILQIISLGVVGVLSWTLMEYLFHRFIFHGEDYWMKILPKNKYLFTFHFLFHGIHHAFP